MPEVTPLHPEDDDDLRAADGRVPGRRGRATRQRLLECTRDMLTTTSYRDVKVIDIAREAGTSPATFYQYFADVEAAILVLAEEMAQQGQHLTAIITDGLLGRAPSAYDTSLALVDALLEFWDDHRPVLRVMDLATDEGDGRFQKIRVRLLNDITNGPGRRHPQRSQVGGRIPEGGWTRWRRPASSCRCSPTPPPTSTASSSGASAPPSSAYSMARQVSWGVTGITPPELTGAPVPTTTIDGVDIAYDVTGDGPPLVLLHGITESRRTWDPLVPDLAEDHTVVAVDLRGHGESAAGPGLRRRRDGGRRGGRGRRLGLPAPVVVGHSMGGVVVTAYAAAFTLCRAS